MALNRCAVLGGDRHRQSLVHQGQAQPVGTATMLDRRETIVVQQVEKRRWSARVFVLHPSGRPKADQAKHQKAETWMAWYSPRSSRTASWNRIDYVRSTEPVGRSTRRGCRRNGSDDSRFALGGWARGKTVRKTRSRDSTRKPEAVPIAAHPLANVSATVGIVGARRYNRGQRPASGTDIIAN